MKKEVEINEYIDHYLKGELTDIQMDGFEKLMTVDSVFAQKVEFQRQVHELIKDGVLHNVRKELTLIHNQKIRYNLFKSRVIGFGLGGLVIVAIVYLFISNLQNPFALNKKNITDPKSKISEIATINQKLAPINVLKSIAYNKKNVPILKVEPNLKAQTNYNISQDSQKSYPTPIDTNYKKANVFTDNPDKADSSTKSKKIIYKNSIKDIRIVDCKRMKINATISSFESCNNKPTGSIAINHLSSEGSLPPFSYSLNRREFGDSSSFSGLYPGSYIVYARDANNCIVKIGTVAIESVSCTYQAVFAPLKDEIWTIPVKQNGKGVIKIFSKSGLLVYSTQVSFGDANLWNGETLSGKQLPMGIYQFEISYIDGTKFNGNVTILR